MKKRMTCTLLAMLLTAGTLAGCAGNPSEKAPAEPSGNASAEAPAEGEGDMAADYDPYGKYDEPVKITSVLGYAPSTDPKSPSDLSPENFSFITAAKEQYNIEFSFMWTAPAEQFAQKFGVAMASGQIPDVMQLAYTDFEVLRENEALASWNEPIKYASPTAKEFIYQDGGDALNSATYDGEIMGLPQYYDNRRELNMMMIRQDWLEELNLKAPTTTAELKEVMQAFKDKKGATQPMAFDKDWGHDPKRLMQSFGAYQNAWIEKDGKLVNGNIQPEMKNALTYLNDLYNSGLIAKDFASYDTNKSTELLINEQTGIIYGPWWFYEFSLNKSIEKNPAARWMAYEIPSAEGDVGKAQMPRVSMEHVFAINAECQNPEAVMKLVNMFVDGNDTGAEWTKPENRYFWSWCVPKYFEPYDITSTYNKWNEQLKADPTFSNPLPDTFTQGEDKNIWAAYPDYEKWKKGDNSITPDPTVFGAIMARQDPDMGWGTTLKVAESGKVVVDEFYGTATETMKEKQSTLDKLTEETVLKIIMGEAPIDEFDQYVESWKNLGGDDITTEVNEWYASRQSE